MAEFADGVEAFELKGELLDGRRVMNTDDVVALVKRREKTT